MYYLIDDQLDFIQAGICYTSWYKALKDQQFAALLTTMGVKLKLHWERHTQVHLATDPEEELVKDIWDIRRLKANYPKHEHPNSFKVDFTWIVNPLLRQQVKLYFRLRLIKWEARTFKTNLGHLKRLLVHFPLSVRGPSEDYPNWRIDFAWKIGSMDYAWNYHPPQPPKPIQSFRDVRAILQRETLCPLWLGRRHATQDSFQPH